MIRDFGYSESIVGLYAGLLTAAFAFCQFLSSYFWGLFSDKYGRRLALLVGLLVSGLAMIMFGTSTVYSQAVGARAISGIFNGNIAVARAYVADITNGRNRAFAFSIFVVAFSVGMVVGSTCGGILVQTYNLDDDGHHKQSVGILKWWIFDTEFPYLLPCLIGSFISFISFGFTMVSVQDATNIQSTPKYSISLHDFGLARQRSKSVPSASTSSLKDTNQQRSRSDISLDDVKAVSIIQIEGIASDALYQQFQSLRSGHHERGLLLGSQENGKKGAKIDSLCGMFRETDIIHGLVINATMMLMAVAWNAMVPLLLAQILEMDSVEIGIYMGYNGVVLFAFTWWIQPALLAKINYKSLFIGFGIIAMVVLIAFPSITLIPRIHEWESVPLVALTSFIGAFKYACTTNLFVVSMCFVNNSVPREVIGRANGLAQAVGAGLRGFGPLVGGALWSWSVSLENKYAVYIAYLFMMIPSAYSTLHCFLFIGKDIQMTWEERRCNQ